MNFKKLLVWICLVSMFTSVLVLELFKRRIMPELYVGGFRSLAYALALIPAIILIIITEGKDRRDLIPIVILLMALFVVQELYLNGIIGMRKYDDIMYIFILGIALRYFVSWLLKMKHRKDTVEDDDNETN